MRHKGPQYQRFAAWLDAKWRESGLSISAFAEQVGVRHNTAIAWVEGRKRPQRDNLARLAELFGEDLNTLRGYAGYETVEVPQVDRADPWEAWRRIDATLDTLTPERTLFRDAMDALAELPEPDRAEARMALRMLLRTIIANRKAVEAGETLRPADFPGPSEWPKNGGTA